MWHKEYEVKIGIFGKQELKLYITRPDHETKLNRPRSIHEDKVIY